MRIAGLVVFSVVAWQARAFATSENTPNYPPPDYFYAQRSYSAQMSASNLVKADDGHWITVTTDPDAHAVDIIDPIPDAYLDSYVEKWDDNTTIFDVLSWQGEFAGISGAWKWTDDSSGISYYSIYQEINGVSHSLNFQTDASGNASEIVATNYRARPDPCKIIADWGALQCPSHFDGIEQIPTDIRKMVNSRMVGWFSDAWHAVSHAVEKGAKAVVHALKDPKVLVIATTVVAVVAIGGCCIGSLGTGCAVCAAGVLGGYSLAIAAILNQNMPDWAEKSDYLRAQGAIDCEDPNLCYNVTVVVP